MSVLDGLTDASEQFEAFPDAHLRLIAKSGQRESVDQFHDEEGSVISSHAAVDHAGDVRMLHQRQGLPFLFKTLNYRLGVHTRLDQFESHLSLDRFGLFGHPDLTHTPFSDL
jgi:hypothetical protein